MKDDAPSILSLDVIAKDIEKMLLKGKDGYEILSFKEKLAGFNTLKSYHEMRMELAQNEPKSNTGGIASYKKAINGENSAEDTDPLTAFSKNPGARDAIAGIINGDKPKSTHSRSERKLLKTSKSASTEGVPESNAVYSSSSGSLKSALSFSARGLHASAPNGAGSNNAKIDSGNNL
jgi:hypothetical protein